MTTIAGRWSVTALFLLSGLTFGTYLIRLPSLKVEHGLDDVGYGALSLVFGAVAIVAMRAITPVMRSIGAPRIARIAVLIVPLAVVAVGTVPGTIGIFATTALLAVAHGVLDVAMNAAAVEVERSAGRPLLSGCHAAWSIGAAVSTIGGAAVIAAGVPTSLHVVTAAIVIVPLGVLCGARLRVGAPAATAAADVEGSTRARSGWSGPVVRIALIATALMIAEGCALGWGGVLLHETKGASLALAAGATTAHTLAQLAGRLIGDRLRSWLRDVPLFRAGAALAAVGLLVAAVVRDPALSLVGFALVGLGGATLVPIAYAETGRRDPTGHAVPRLTVFTYAGVLAGPGAIGVAAAGIGLAPTVALIAPLLALAAVAFPAGAARPRAASASGPA